MRETPKINRLLMFLKIIAVVAPLLGLLGTVTGMIITFQAITLFGTGDPKIHGRRHLASAGHDRAGPMRRNSHGVAAYARVQPRQAGESDPGRNRRRVWSPCNRKTGTPRWPDSGDEKLYYTLPQLEAVRDFFELGGDVLLLIGVLTLVMWGLIFERLLYFAVRYPRVARATIEKWDARAERASWNAHRIREYMISTVGQELERNMLLIRTCVALCPLLGLLGTSPV